MGDGAFSNVYKAIERKSGQKCAVKVVRKYELNHSQVRKLSGCLVFFFFFFFLFFPPSPVASHALATHGTKVAGETLRLFFFFPL